MFETILVDILYILVIAGITGFIRYGVPFINSKIASIKDDSLRLFVEDAVQFAENQMEKNGIDKFAYVYEVTTNYCSQHGMNINPEQTKILIESIFNSLDMAGFVNKNK